MTQDVFLKDTWHIIEEKLNAGAEVTINPGGISMKPLVIPGRDSVVLVKTPDILKKYDVVMYIRTNGQFVLHRIVDKDGDDFIMCGDNQFYWERGIKREQIIALMDSVVRKGKRISSKSLFYRLYSRFWVRFQRLNYFARRIKNKLFRMLKRNVKK